MTYFLWIGKKNRRRPYEGSGMRALRLKDDTTGRNGSLSTFASVKENMREWTWVAGRLWQPECRNGTSILPGVGTIIDWCRNQEFCSTVFLRKWGGFERLKPTRPENAPRSSTVDFDEQHPGQDGRNCERNRSHPPQASQSSDFKRVFWMLTQYLATSIFFWILNTCDDSSDRRKQL